MWSYAATPNLQEPPKEDQVPDDLDLENFEDDDLLGEETMDDVHGDSV